MLAIPESMRVTAIIPALDEEGAIGATVAGLDRTLIHEVIVVDNGSRDRTADCAAAAGARVVLEPRRGYGSACLTGVRAAGPGGILVFLDGDGSDAPEDVARVLNPIRQGVADLVLGSRLDYEAGALSTHQRWGNRVVLALVRLLYGLRLADFGSFRAIRAETLARLGMAHPTFGWPIEMVVKAARHHLRIVEVPVKYRRRIGRSKVAGTLRGSVLSGYHFFVTVLRYAWGPLR
ncbi:MAG TPA: glycosyltransferase family 2 protein [Candidatus Baltobacteraceae bacterium]|nr:glycosyltransferase family 2 protein [Candidatus Baltobacteraceae bacterium]